jgi:predicted dienelactone hydrolase
MRNKLSFKLSFIRPLLIVFAAFLLANYAVAAASNYQPLNALNTFTIHELTVEDLGRQRSVPLLVYLPQTTNLSTANPVILFSHGLGGSKQGSAFLGKHWASRGYVAIFMQHLGSDSAIWQNEQPAKRMLAMKRAANIQNFMLRTQDVHVVIDQLAQWQKQTGHTLFGKMDLTHIGMAGHSFGAVTTQAVFSGWKFTYR